MAVRRGQFQDISKLLEAEMCFLRSVDRCTRQDFRNEDITNELGIESVTENNKI